jgi:hypothetical protein
MGCGVHWCWFWRCIRDRATKLSDSTRMEVEIFVKMICGWLSWKRVFGRVLGEWNREGRAGREVLLRWRICGRSSPSTAVCVRTLGGERRLRRPMDSAPLLGVPPEGVGGSGMRFVFPQIQGARRLAVCGNLRAFLNLWGRAIMGGTPMPLAGNVQRPMVGSFPKFACWRKGFSSSPRALAGGWRRRCLRR